MKEGVVACKKNLLFITECVHHLGVTASQPAAHHCCALGGLYCSDLNAWPEALSRAGLS